MCEKVSVFQRFSVCRFKQGAEGVNHYLISCPSHCPMFHLIGPLWSCHLLTGLWRSCKLLKPPPYLTQTDVLTVLLVLGRTLSGLEVPPDCASLSDSAFVFSQRFGGGLWDLATLAGLIITVLYLGHRHLRCSKPERHMLDPGLFLILDQMFDKNLFEKSFCEYIYLDNMGDRCLSVCLCLCLSLSLPLCLCVCLSVSLSVCVYLLVSLSLRLNFFLSLPLSLCLCLSPSLITWNVPIPEASVQWGGEEQGHHPGGLLHGILLTNQDPAWKISWFCTVGTRTRPSHTAQVLVHSSIRVVPLLPRKLVTHLYQSPSVCTKHKIL